LAKDDLVTLSAVAAAQDIAKGVVSAEDYVRACLDRIAEVEPEVRAFAHLDPDHAIAQAKLLDDHRQQGGALGPLHGIPVAIKDIIDTSDYPTEFGSPVFAGRQPQHDATIVSKLRAAGAVIIGKTVTTEFAYYNPGKTRNPHDVERTPGGSSSGSAAAVAAGMVPLAIGSQTNGSIIRPASFCGVFALKPSHGQVSRNGVLPLSQVLDHIGPFARNLPDLALIMETLAGYDPDDEDTRAVAVPPYQKAATEDFPLEPRVAFVRTPIWDKADEATREAFEKLAKDLGDNCVELELPPEYANAWDAIRIIMLVDMGHRFGPVADKHGEAVSKVMRDLIDEGRTVTAMQYLAALDLRHSLAERLNHMFSQFNAIMTPAAPGVAPIGHGSTGNPAFCSLWTLVGLPSMSLPLLEGEGGMPLGVQLVGARNDDFRLFRTAKWLAEKTAPKGKKRARKS
jgi:Asp-tRNA(Asn)/Glu-tRNA(Gln) amidotransferase A subunit family amidase